MDSEVEFSDRSVITNASSGSKAKPRPARPKKSPHLIGTPSKRTASWPIQPGVLHLPNGFPLNGYPPDGHALPEPSKRSEDSEQQYERDVPVPVSRDLASELIKTQSFPSTNSDQGSDSARSNTKSSKWGPVKQKVKTKSTAKRLFDKQPGEESKGLCSPCEGLKLTFDKFVIDNDRPREQILKGSPDFWGKRLMGTYQQIRDKANCTLCSLLCESMSHVSRKELQSDSTLQAECRVHWTVDGRERIQQGKANKLRTVKRTRRLSIEWSHKPYERLYIVLVAPEGKFAADGKINKGEWERPTLFLGRLLTTVDQSNVEKIREWLDICKTHHEEECKIHDDLKGRFEQVLLQSPFFSVIDVKEMRLTSLPDKEGADVRYTALSYTWGEESRISGGHNPPKSEMKPRFKALKSNRTKLTRPQGIRAVMNDLPMSIQNAIYLTEKLGIRYIWVDSLCIVQDNDKNWTLNADVMDVVYSNAELTICAADGDGSDEVGLQALFPPGRFERTAKEFSIDYPLPDQKQLKLLLSRPSESYIRESRWNKRAWTFQERLLSRRCVIFVAGRVYFQCRSVAMSEDIYSEAAQAGWSVELQGSPALTLNGLANNPVSVFKECLALYTSRSLSKETDILAAFGGILNIIRACVARECPAMFGMPASHFDYALLWQPEESPERRKVKGKSFPSWSWCGWKGKTISYRASTVAGLEVNLHEWLLNHTWITFYIRDGQGDLRLVWDPLRYECAQHIDQRWAGYEHTDDAAKLPGGSRYHKTDMEYSELDYHARKFNREVPKRGRVEHAGWQFMRKYEEYPNHVKVLNPGEEGRSQRGPREDEPVLQFWTWTAEFYLGEEADGEPFSNGTPVGAGLKRFAILDSDGDFAGTCVLDETWSKAATARTPQRFIALSDARDFDASEYGCWSLYTEDSRDINHGSSEPWQLFNVMMLCDAEGEHYEYDDEEEADVAYRAGIGKVYKSAFECCGSEGSWKEIILG